MDATLNPTHFYDFPGTYIVRLVAHDSVCFDTSYTTVVVLDSVQSTGLPGILSDNSIYVYYEGDEVFLLFDLPENRDVRIDIFNGLGGIVLRQEIRNIRKEKIKLDMNEFSPGIYFSMITMKEGIVVKKIIIQKH